MTAPAMPDVVVLPDGLRLLTTPGRWANAALMQRVLASALDGEWRPLPRRSTDRHNHYCVYRCASVGLADMRGRGHRREWRISLRGRIAMGVYDADAPVRD